MKRSESDRLFSLCIRTEANWTCQKCGTQYEVGSRGLHCSHNFSRRHRTIRWCKDNALALCCYCHEWFGGNPADSGKWLEEKLGDGTMEILREKKNSKMKVTKLEEKEIAAHYKQQLKKLQQQLLDNQTLNFDSYQ